jgi:hypothetical protein
MLTIRRGNNIKCKSQVFKKRPEDGPIGPILAARLKYYKKFVLCLTVLYINPVKVKVALQ